MSIAYRAQLETCQRHAARLSWAMTALRTSFPLTAAAIKALSDTDLAILDQFSTRFAKLQDAMGAKLFPAILELSKEPGNYPAFLDKLNQLEKIGAIESATQWLILREMRNQFAHDYPDDSELQAAVLNKAYALAQELLAVLAHVEKFASAYLAMDGGI
ncbi:MAG: hypothetical protein ACXWTX_01330 [Gallionella sp.]